MNFRRVFYSTIIYAALPRNDHCRECSQIDTGVTAGLSARCCNSLGQLGQNILVPPRSNAAMAGGSVPVRVCRYIIVGEARQ